MASAERSWTLNALKLTVSKIDSATEIVLDNLVTSFEVAQGEHAVDFIPTIAGGRIPKLDPAKETKITMELYPTGADYKSTVPTGISQLFFGTADETTAISSTITNSRSLFRITALLTYGTPSTPSNATGALTTTQSWRFVFADGYMTEHSTSFSDFVLKANATFVFPPFDNLGNACMKEESTSASESLSALANYTSTVQATKW